MKKTRSAPKCPDFGTRYPLCWKAEKEVRTMTTISILCTMCGAAALSRGILKVIEYIGR